MLQVQDLQGPVLQNVQGALGGQLVGAGTVGNRLHGPSHMRLADAEDRVMLYVRQEAEEIFTPLHVVPPSVQGLLNAVSIA